MPLSSFALEQRPATRVRTGIAARGGELLRPLDHLRQRLRVLRPRRREVLRDLHRELRPPDGVVELVLRVEQPLRIADVDDGRARLAHGVERRLDDPVDIRVGPEEVARDADARALQRVRFEELRVVGLERALRSSSSPRRRCRRRS